MKRLLGWLSVSILTMLLILPGVALAWTDYEFTFSESYAHVTREYDSYLFHNQSFADGHPSWFNIHLVRRRTLWFDEVVESMLWVEHNETFYRTWNVPAPGRYRFEYYKPQGSQTIRKSLLGF